MQTLSPDAYAKLELPDQWIEDAMQETEVAWIIGSTKNDMHLLEMGWGSGIIATELDEAGKDISVVEGSAKFCDDAMNAEILAHHCIFEEFEAPRQYDCVIASFILEHITDPVTLLKRIHQWTNKLIVVVGNANSYHRQIAVRMEIQRHLDSLSERDKTVGHLRVYSRDRIYSELLEAGWIPTVERGLGLKCLPNSMLAKLDPAIAKTMIQMECDPETAANLFMVCIPE